MELLIIERRRICASVIFLYKPLNNLVDYPELLEKINFTIFFNLYSTYVRATKNINKDFTRIGNLYYVQNFFNIGSQCNIFVNNVSKSSWIIILFYFLVHLPKYCMFCVVNYLLIFPLNGKQLSIIGTVIIDLFTILENVG